MKPIWSHRCQNCTSRLFSFKIANRKKEFEETVCQLLNREILAFIMAYDGLLWRIKWKRKS